MHEGQRYRSSRTFEKLKKFVLSHLSVDVKTVTQENWDHQGFRKQQWLLFLCGDHSNCPEYETQLKLASILVIFVCNLKNKYQRIFFINRMV